MGSKSRIAHQIVPIIQKYIDDNKVKNYIEPFVGGANIADKIQCEHKYCSDIREPLIELLKYVQRGGDLPLSISKEEYSLVRSNPEEYEKWYVGCVGFLASYNGRYFDGGYAHLVHEKTKTRTRVRNYYKEARNNLLHQASSELFQDIIFRCCDYKELYKKCQFKNCVIYCDPPYQGAKQYSNSKNFDYEDFWNEMRKWSKENIVLISELRAPDDFTCVWKKQTSRSIKVNDKNMVTEKLFMYKEETDECYINQLY